MLLLLLDRFLVLNLLNSLMHKAGLLTLLCHICLNRLGLLLLLLRLMMLGRQRRLRRRTVRTRRHSHIGLQNLADEAQRLHEVALQCLQVRAVAGEHRVVQILNSTSGSGGR